MNINTTHTNSKARCPVCKMTLDAATSIGGSTPSEGDISICSGCASALVFNKDLTLRQLTDDELAALPAENQAELYFYRRFVMNRLAG